jgi:hypothetical protein
MEEGGTTRLNPMGEIRFGLRAGRKFTLAGKQLTQEVKWLTLRDNSALLNSMNDAGDLASALTEGRETPTGIRSTAEALRATSLWKTTCGTSGRRRDSCSGT